MIYTDRWFDQKYAKGQQPSLEDKAELFSGIGGIDFTDRAREGILRALKEHLYHFERPHGYTPSIHAKTHQLLFCVAPLAGIPLEELREYVQRYKRALVRHERHNVFKENYSSEEE